LTKNFTFFHPLWWFFYFLFLFTINKGCVIFKLDHTPPRKGGTVQSLRPTIEDAISLAADSHKNQTDKAGAPYIYHPLRVMFRLETEKERIIAVLHDVLEDCDVTPKDLRDMGYDKEIIEALDFLTKRKEEEGDYDAFIERIRRGPIVAIKVKLADLADNMDPVRRRVKEENSRYERRMEKYRRAKAVLEEVRASRLQIT
jgi:(p)ppGpp synthase/HD superfamily hydrolase